LLSFQVISLLQITMHILLVVTRKVHKLKFTTQVSRSVDRYSFAISKTFLVEPTDSLYW